MNFSFFNSIFSPSKNPAKKMQTISATSAVQFYGDKETIFVDVRGLAEITNSGTIKGALLAPLPELSSHAKTDGSSTLPAVNDNMRIIIVCASGARSSAATQQLMHAGYDNVASLAGGIGAWTRAGGAMGR